MTIKTEMLHDTILLCPHIMEQLGLIDEVEGNFQANNCHVFRGWFNTINHNHIAFACYDC